VRAREPQGSADRQAAFVLDLQQVGRRDLDRAGGKGANLGELVRAGFPVPAGFVVTTAAYDRFVADNDLGKGISRALAEADGGAVRAAFQAAPVPPEIE
jgi:phosphoenolpyruvate synthase/pyruvate phosphate dikinase